MVLNIIGDCDKRPVLYTAMKIMQTVGDVLLVTSSTRLKRLSDTGETGGHYQNIKIAVTTEGLDDFFEGFQYSLYDFEGAIIDNIVAAEADVTIYVKGMVQTEAEKDMLEYVTNYVTIEPFALKDAQSTMFYNCEKFEAYRNMNPISAKLAAEVAKALAPALNTTVDNLTRIALGEPKGSSVGKAPEKKVPLSPPKPNPDDEDNPQPQPPKKKGLFGR